MTMYDTPIATESIDEPYEAPEQHSSGPRAVTIVVARVLSGLFAGFFLTYAMSVVVGLAPVDDLTYVTTFQSINATIRNPTFAVVFFGTVPAALLATLLNERHRRLLGAGTALLFASVIITFVWNVPLNDQLATYVHLDVESATTARNAFEDTWNRWNLLRTATSIAGAICICVAGVRRR